MDPPHQPKPNQQSPACLQISAVLKSGSAEGLSPLSFELETAGLLVHSSYGFLTRMPFNAYG